MLRICLLICVALWAGSAMGQVTDDPRAVAPVAYSDAPGADCVADTTTSDCVAPAGTVVSDDTPVVETDWDYYPGVSLWADDDYPYYWNGPYGWPYTSYVGFGFGWPYYGYGYGFAGIGFGLGFGYWHGGYWHHHGHWNGWGGHYAYDGRYPGPYRYAGHGRYWNSTHDGARPVGVYHGGIAGADRTLARGGAPLRSAGFGRAAPGNGAPMRQALPSASYFAAARGANGYRAGAPVGVARGMTGARPALANGRAADGRNPYRVTAMPSRGYAQSGYRSGANYSPRTSAGYAQPTYRGGSGMPRTASGYAPTRSYVSAGRPAGAAPVHGYANYGGGMHGGGYAHAAPAAHYSGGGGHSGGGHSGGGHSGSASHSR